MIILLPFLRKLSIRRRTLLGRGLLIAGLLGLVIGLVAAPVLVIVSAATVLVGVIALASARSAGRRTARA